MTGEATLHPVEPLSAREEEVLAALGEHLTNAEIADRFVLSVRTVESHVSSLLRKTGAKDRRALAALAARPGTPAPVAATLRGAPVPSTGFVGRADAAAALTAALAEARLVTLTGLGGMGKTRLATRVAAEVAATRSDGGWFVDLSPATQGNVTTAIAAAVGVTEHAAAPLVDALVGRLGPSDGLLLLDNCEHVLDDVASLVDRLRSAGAALSVLATSREPLGLVGERVVALGPLDVGADAVQLFADRAVASDATFDPGAHAEQITEICRRLDGLPLALELAAVRIPSLGVDGLLAALDDLLDVASGGRGATERHRSLRSVLDWSAQLLDADERSALRRLSVVSASVSAPEVAELLMMSPLAAGDLLGRLTAKSLLVRMTSPAGVSRWRMLDTVRAYGRELLDASGETADARSRHAGWAASVADQLDPRSAEWPAAFDKRVDDLRAAVDWTRSAAGQHDAAIALGLRLAWLLYARRFFAESQERFVEAGEAAEGSAAAAAWRRAAEVALIRMRGPDWLELFTRAAAVARAADDTPAAATCHALAAGCAGRFPGELDPAQQARAPQLLEEAERDAATVRDDPVVDAHLAMARVWASRTGNDVSDADAVVTAEQAAQAIGDPVLLSAALDGVTMLAWRDAPARAVEIVQRRVGMLDDLDAYDPRAGVEILDILHMATDVQLQAGRLVDGRASALRQRDSDIPSGAAHIAQRGLVVALGLTGELDACLAATATMLDGWERVGNPPAAWMGPAVLAAMIAAALLGRTEDEARLLAMATDVADNAAGFRAFALARVALWRGDPAAALATFREHESPLEEAGWSGYAVAVPAEAALACGDPDAGALVSAATEVAAWHPWAGAALARAQAAGDPAALAAAADLFEAAGAEVEALLTRAAGGDDRARAELGRRGVVGFG